MKKEFNGWVFHQKDNDYNGIIFRTRLPSNFESFTAVKATLVLDIPDIPEKKIEISMSDFNEAFEDACDRTGTFKAMKMALKQNLFGETRNQPSPIKE